jgi:hypothetical protein
MGGVVVLAYIIPLLVCRRGPAKNAGNDDETLLKMEVIDDAVVAYSAAPSGFLPLEAFQIPLKGIDLHSNEDRFNALLIFSRELFEVFLCWTGD